MKRFAIEQLKQWKDKKDRKPLIIRGARQVGKTWLMKEFGRTCFDNVAYVNFDSNARMKNVFDGEIDIPRIIMAISIETGMTIDSHNTLIIFDEIQEVPKALSSLKYLRDGDFFLNIASVKNLVFNHQLADNRSYGKYPYDEHVRYAFLP